MSSRPRNHRRSALAVGVTGHRPHHLRALQLARLLAHARDVLREVAQADAVYADGPVVLYSALAEGADRHLARLALAYGYALYAVLPFARADYAADFEAEESVREFRRLIDEAQRVIELPGDRRHPGAAYENAGHAILDSVDLLIAVWDGAPSRGRGGTGDIVAEAWRRRIPIVHLSTVAHAPPTLLHAGGRRAPALDLQHTPDRPLAGASLRALVADAHARRKGMHR